MPKITSVKWPDTLQDAVLSPIDNVVATPFNNYEFLRCLKNQTTCPGSHPEPYSDINCSPHPLLFKGSILFFGFFGIIFSFFISFYKRLRKQEGFSHYFFFENLYKILGKNKLGDALGHCSIPLDYLYAVAYFYNPDIPSIVLWFRKKKAVLTRHTAFLNLEKYLNAEIKKNNVTKYEILEMLNGEINKKVGLFISSQKKFGEWTCEKNGNKWYLRPCNDYFAAWQLKNGRMQDNSSANASSSNSNRSSKSARFWEFVITRLDELGKASFVYWVGVFVFYFIPSVCLIGGTAWIPILIAFVYLNCLWFTKLYKWRTHEQKKIFNDESDYSKRDTIFYIEVVKHRLLLDALVAQGNTDTPCFTKVKFRERSEDGFFKYKESKLCKDIKKVLKIRSELRFVRAIFNGFIIGCFIIFFSSWLLMAAIGLFITLNPTIIALITLSLGLTYGTYTGVKYYQQEVQALMFLQKNFEKLQNNYSEIEIPDVSLRECDRLFRRGIVNPTFGTIVKQFSKRLWTGFIRFGTGMLFLKLLPLGTITAIMGGVAITSTLTFLPMLAVMLAGGFFFAGCYIWLYHYESKGKKAGRVMDFFLKGSYEVINSGSSIRAVNINNNEEYASLSQKISPTPTTPLDANESAFNLSNLGSTLFAKSLDQPQIEFLDRRLRKLSNSECCLSEEITTIDDISCNKLENNNESQGNLVRKRSNTLPPSISYDLQKKELIDRKAVEELKKYNVIYRKRSLFVNCNPNVKTSSSRSLVTQGHLVMSH